MKMKCKGRVIVDYHLEPVRAMMNRSRFPRDIRDFGEIGKLCSPREIRGGLSHHFDSFHFV